jgi:aminoacyl tRNA synthase complex-interacting multifunctional protein 1
MEFQSSVGKLSSPLKDLVLSVTQNGSLHVGKQEKDEREVIEWIAKIEQGDLVNEPGLKVHPANMRVHIK